MELDLLFTAVERQNWKKTTESGSFESDSYKDDGTVWCFTGDEAEAYINKHFESASELLLIVIDPSRIQVPIKQVKKDDFTLIAVQGTFSLDSIIDKIQLEKDKNGKFSVRVKHFD